MSTAHDQARDLITWSEQHPQYQIGIDLHYQGLDQDQDFVAFDITCSEAQESAALAAVPWDANTDASPGYDENGPILRVHRGTMCGGVRTGLFVWKRADEMAAS